MSARLPWFKCFPTKLLGTLAEMDPDEGHLYVTILLRIYEDGGPIKDTAKVLARRTNMTERRAVVAIASLAEFGRVTILDGGMIDSETTHEYLHEREEFLNVAKNAGKASAAKRAEKRQQNQQINATDVDIPFNGTPTKNIDIEINKKDTSLRSDNSADASAALLPKKRKLKKRLEETQLTADSQPNDAQSDLANAAGLDAVAFRFHWQAFRAYFVQREEWRQDWTGTWANWLKKIRPSEKNMGSRASPTQRPADEPRNPALKAIKKFLEANNGDAPRNSNEPEFTSPVAGSRQQPPSFGSSAPEGFDGPGGRGPVYDLAAWR